MDLFWCVFNDKWLTKFDQSYIHLKVEVIFCVIVEPSEDVNAVSVWDLQASAATSGYDALVGFVGGQDLYGLAWLGLGCKEDEVGDSWRVGGVRELAHQRFSLVVEHGPEE